MPLHAVHVSYVVTEVIVAINGSAESYGAHCCVLLTLSDDAVVKRYQQIVAGSIQDVVVR